MPAQTSMEFDYRQHVRDGGKLTFSEFKKRKREWYRIRQIAQREFDRERAKLARQQRGAQP